MPSWQPAENEYRLPDGKVWAHWYGNQQMDLPRYMTPDAFEYWRKEKGGEWKRIATMESGRVKF